MKYKIKIILLIIIFILSISSCSYISEQDSLDSRQETKSESTLESDNEIEKNTKKDKNNNSFLNEEGHYYSKNDVALYIHTFKKLPSNYITKNEAKKLGWDSQQGNLWEVTKKGVIGGDVFGNREGKLPRSEKYYEADVNYNGGHRGAERLVYTKDGKVIYYTKDHYKNFEVLYE